MGLWRWFRSWWQRPSLAGVEVILYTRRGCHLCDDALVPLEKARRHYGFSLIVRDVDRDASWIAAYGELVPVVEIEGKVRFRGRVNEVLLERLLHALTRT